RSRTLDLWPSGAVGVAGPHLLHRPVGRRRCRGPAARMAMTASVAPLVVALLVLVVAGRRLLLALLTVPAPTLTPPLSRWLSRWLGALDSSADDFVRADGAGERWVAVRRDAIERLAATLRARFQKSSAWGDDLRQRFSDLRFTDANRVPFPFARLAREKLNVCSVVTASAGPRLLDLD